MDIKVSCKGSGYLDIGTFKQLQGDLKDISASNLKLLKARIVKYGFDAPVFTWGSYILDGHQRIAAIQSLISDGYELPGGKLPICEIDATDIKDAKKRLLGYVSQYGKITSSGFGHFVDSIELSDVEINDVVGEIDLPDFDYLSHFAIEVEANDAEPKVDQADELQKLWNCKRGQIWACGPHRIMCGDSINPADVEQLMDGIESELMFTSPPYSDMRDYKGDVDLSICNLTGFIGVWEQYCKYMAVNLGLQRKDRQIVQYWDDYLEAAHEAGYLFLAWNVWAKSSAGSIGSQTAFIPITHEWIFVFGDAFKDINRTVVKKSPKKKAQKQSVRQKDGTTHKGYLGQQNTFKEMESVFYSNTELGKIRQFHPATFPVELPSEYIKAMTDKSDIVTDCFLGSGTTLIACENTDRVCYGMEISPEYVSVSLQRYQDATGVAPVLIKE